MERCFSCGESKERSTIPNLYWKSICQDCKYKEYRELEKMYKIQAELLNLIIDTINKDYPKIKEVIKMECQWCRTFLTPPNKATTTTHYKGRELDVCSVCKVIVETLEGERKKEELRYWKEKVKEEVEIEYRV